MGTDYRHTMHPPLPKCPVPPKTVKSIHNISLVSKENGLRLRLQLYMKFCLKFSGGDVPGSYTKKKVPLSTPCFSLVITVHCTCFRQGRIRP